MINSYICLDITSCQPLLKMIASTLEYFKDIKGQKLILWCYLIWYLVIIFLYFEPSLKLWASSLGISCIIGFALILSTAQKGNKQDVWIKIRLFLFPFCVSSYSATIKDYDFILLFPVNKSDLLISFSSCLAFLLLVYCVKRFYRRNMNISG